MPLLIPDEATLTTWLATAMDVCRDELAREADAAYLASMVQVAATPPPDGGSKEAMIRVTQASPEWHARHDRPPRPALVPRPPLPPMPGGTYNRTLPFPPPARDVLFYRGNFCGCRIAGIPLVPGMAGDTLPRVNRAQPLVMALDVFKFHDPDTQNQILTAHAQRGYTHYQCSIGHAIEQGLTIAQYVEFSARVQAIVGFADHWFLGGGPWSRRDADRAYWQSQVQPWIDALLANGVIDCACVGWQLDQFNAPGDPMLGIIDYFAEQLGPHAIPIGTHWVNEAGGWWQTGGTPGDRFQWWKRMRNRLTWFHHQGDPLLDVPTYQAKLVDTLQPFGDGRMGTSGLFGDRPFGLVVYECSAQAQFDDPTRFTEDWGDQRGYLLCCTRAAASVSGYGNGARLPDGAPL